MKRQSCKGIFVVFLLLLSRQLNAQSAIGLPKIIPPSPTAMQMQKYGDYPVSHFTGVPSVDIPLYTIKEGNIELPVSFSYHASGLKPNDSKSFFGQGWTLNAGGMVSKTTYGNDDHVSVFPNPFKAAAELSQHNQNDIHYLNDLDNGSPAYDSEYDIYSYSINGASGKFLLKQPGNVAVQFPYKPVKIVKNNIYDFVITDEQGYKYAFGPNTDGVYGGASNDGSAHLLNSWFAREIASPNGSNKITFKYTAPVREQVLARNDRIVYDDYVSTSLSDGHLVPYCNYTGQFNFMNVPYHYADIITDGRAISSLTYWTQLPQLVSFSNGSVKFTYDATSSMLLKMEVFALSGSLLKRIEFAYNAGASGSRYLLNAIKFYDGNGVYLNEYRFSYNQGSLIDMDDCKSIDFWGYYNGRSNPNLVPRFDNFNVQPTLPGFYEYRSFGSADRSTVEGAMKIGVLERIEYPTGGATVFDYESNKYMVAGVLKEAGGLRVKSITSYSGENKQAFKKTYKYGNNESGGGWMEVQPALDNFYYTQLVNRFSYEAIQVQFNYRRLTFNSSSLIDLSPFGSPVVYENVTEYTDDGTGNLGRTIYTYDLKYNISQSYPGVSVLGNESFPVNYRKYDPLQKRWAMGGDLVSSEVFKKMGSQYVTVSKETNLYEEYIRENVRNFKMYRVIVPDPDCFSNTYATIRDYDWLTGSAFFEPFSYVDYNWVSGEKRLVQKETVNDGVSNTVNYTYANDEHIQPTQIITTGSKGKAKKTVLQYPGDLKSSSAPNIYNQMYDAHIWSPVITDTRYANTSFLQKTSTEYYNWGNNLFAPQTVSMQVLSGANDVRLRYKAYDESGNVLTVAKENDQNVAYIWGYNKSYPIAQITGAKATDVFFTSFEEGDGNSADGDCKTGKKSKVGGFSKVLINLTNGIYVLGYFSKTGSAWQWQEAEVTVGNGTYTINLATQVDEVRLHPKGAQMTSFTYAPLIGVTTTCSPAGRVSYYEYDGAGRLRLTRDDSRNILQRYCYNYLGQSTDCGANDNLAQWQRTGVSRYRPCTLNTGFLSDVVQYEEKDTNPASATYNQLRWVDAYAFGVVRESDWVNTATPVRCRQTVGQNTGELEQEQRYANPCSNWYNTLRWVVISTNTGTCPVPAYYTSSDKSGDYYSANCAWPLYPNPVHVSVPAGMFTSSISVADADNKATQYAQDYANQHGTCHVLPVSIKVVNNANVGGSVIFTLTNVATQQVYQFSYNGTNAVIGEVPPGDYDMHVVSNSSIVFTLTAGCYYSVSGDNVWLYNVPIGDCDTFYLD